MLIRDRSIMEKAMHYTHEDLAAKRKELSDKVSERKVELLDLASQLVREYKQSLGYQGQNDGQLVFVGNVVEGRVQPIQLALLALDENYHLIFSIITDLTPDSHIKDYMFVDMELYKESGRVTVIVGSDKKSKFPIVRGEPAGSFAEVCAAIKQNIVDIIHSNMPK